MKEERSTKFESLLKSALAGQEYREEDHFRRYTALEYGHGIQETDLHHLWCMCPPLGTLRHRILALRLVFLKNTSFWVQAVSSHQREHRKKNRFTNRLINKPC